MTRADAIKSLETAYATIEADPELEGVDTLALMQEAIECCLEYFTGTQPAHITSTDDIEEEDTEA